MPAPSTKHIKCACLLFNFWVGVSTFNNFWLHAWSQYSKVNWESQSILSLQSIWRLQNTCTQTEKRHVHQICIKQLAWKWETRHFFVWPYLVFLLLFLQLVILAALSLSMSEWEFSLHAAHTHIHHTPQQEICGKTFRSAFHNAVTSEDTTRTIHTHTSNEADRP